MFSSESLRQRINENDNWCYKIKINYPEEMSKFPIYRVMDTFGNIVNQNEEPTVLLYLYFIQIQYLNSDYTYSFASIKVEDICCLEEWIEP